MRHYEIGKADRNKLVLLLCQRLDKNVTIVEQYLDDFEAEDDVLVGRAADGDKASLNELLDLYRDRVRHRSDGRTRQSSGLRTVVLSDAADGYSPSAAEEELALALRPTLARVAANLAGVRRFRDTVLSGQALTRSQAQSLIKSPAAAWLPVEGFTSGPVPVDHIAHAVVDYTASDGARTVRLLVTPPGLLGDGITYPAESIKSVTFAIDGDTKPVEITYGPGTALDELIRLADDLVSAFPWTIEDAIEFILIDTDPMVELIEISAKHIGSNDIEPWSRVEVTIVADLNASARSVANAFSYAQRKLLGDRNRLPSARSLSALHYAERWKRRNPNAPPHWRHLCQEWESQSFIPGISTGQRKGDRSTKNDDDFGGMVRRCWKRLLGLHYTLSAPNPRHVVTATEETNNTV